jgi:PilZ domain
MASKVMSGCWLGGGADKPGERSEPRVQTQPFPVRIHGESRGAYGYVRDLSQSGMQIRTFAFGSPEPRLVGERINIRFALPGGGPELNCAAQVVWNMVPGEGPHRYNIQGVRIVDMENSARARLSDWLNSACSTP